MSLPPEKASELKQLIHQQLSKMDVHGRIREILAETIREELAPDQQHLSTEDLIKALRRRGIIDDVMKELNFVTDSVEQELPSSPKQPICFDRQSTLKKSDGTRMADSTTMLSISDPIHMVLIKTDIFGETTLVASYFLEWRSVLGSENGVTSLTVELMGVGTESKVSVGILNIKLEMYPPLNQTLSQEVVNTQGDCEDHANLLCSLLLGYGLEAFVCVGTKAKGVPHAWVMTCGTDGTITFWESLTGHRYIHKPTNPDEPPVAEQPKPLYPYRTIGCVFNHQMFLGNCQPSDAVETCVFDLNDESKWKPMSEEAIKSVCAPGATTSLPPFPPLCASTIDASVTSNEIEMQLRLLVSEHRKDLGLTTVWEDQLSYLLSPALASYEFERTTSISAGNEEFQDAIRRAVPDGHTFKGFPIHFVYRNARRAFATCLRSPFCEEIICCRGDQVRLAVRVRVFTYPESACAVWIMFACKYRSVL
uniref:Centrosomal protein of 76 kDa n=1 Tax=Colobus angolensis palliatus TaxID=336983 RepID=A0A2K5HT54_COLAP